MGKLCKCCFFFEIISQHLATFCHQDWQDFIQQHFLCWLALRLSFCVCADVTELHSREKDTGYLYMEVEKSSDGERDWYVCCFWVMESLVQFVQALKSCKMRRHAYRPQDPVRFLGRHGLSCHGPHQPTALVQVACHAWSVVILTFWSPVLVLPKTGMKKGMLHYPKMAVFQWKISQFVFVDLKMSWVFTVSPQTEPSKGTTFWSLCVLGGPILPIRSVSSFQGLPSSGRGWGCWISFVLRCFDPLLSKQYVDDHIKCNDIIYIAAYS